MKKRILIMVFVPILLLWSSTSIENERLIKQVDEIPAEPGYSVPDEYLALMGEMAERHAVPLWLACRLINRENDLWDPQAISPENKNGTRDLGLMQHSDANLESFTLWYRHGKKYDPFNARDNVDVGLAHLRWLYEQFGTWSKALMAYNGGERNVWNGTPKESTIQYARAVMGAWYGR